jgi:hypothetical protein
MFYRFILIFSLLLQGISVHAQSEITFTAEPEIQKIAEDHSRNCIKLVKAQFKIELDGSDASVLSLEPILDHLSNYVKTKGMPQKRIVDFARMYGFYIGETYRKNHGGVSWGLVNIDGQEYFGLGKTETNEAFIWPVANVLKRIQMGPEANIATYYNAITEK